MEILFPQRFHLFGNKVITESSSGIDHAKYTTARFSPSQSIFGGFQLVIGDTPKMMVYFMENAIYTWMMTGGSLMTSWKAPFTDEF